MGIFRSKRSRADALNIAEDTMRDSASRGEGGIVTALASAMALLFSAYSLYETSVRRPDLRAFVPPVIRYSSPYTNSNFEVFEVPVTFLNLGARAGTVLSMDLEVENPRQKTKKLFYSADFGRWTMDNASHYNFRPYAPISLPGKASTSESVLFYARPDEKIEQVANDQGLYRFKLTLNTVFPEDLGFFDRYWLIKPTPVTFEMVMPEIDHRVFTQGTLPLHAPNWHVAEPGAAAPASEAPAAKAEKMPTPAEAAADEAEAHKTDCLNNPGATITSAGFDLKTGKATSSDYVCPDTPDPKAK
jgi:hypothetical protein